MRRLSARTFSWCALVALALNVAIVLTGAAVRVTGSGLGCPTWPTCDGARLIGEWEYHAVIEWGNRLFTTLVTLGVLACLAASFLRRPRRADLCWLSGALVAGVVAQAGLGGVTVLYDLRPPFVMAHFALSMLLVFCGLVLWQRARETPPVLVPLKASKSARLTCGVAAVVVVLGTATTAAGPHSGGEDIMRLGSLELAVKVHGTAVLVLVALAFATRLALTGTPAARVSSVQLWILAGQGLVGWVQYQLQLPRGLVELHVAGAIAVWVSSAWVALRVHGVASPRAVLSSRRAAAPSRPASLEIVAMPKPASA